MDMIAQKARFGLGMLVVVGLAACANVPSDSPFKNGDIYNYEPSPVENVRAISYGELHFSD